jgi:hypothetical protein
MEPEQMPVLMEIFLRPERQKAWALLLALAFPNKGCHTPDTQKL